MNARQLRRAQERKERKLARKAEQPKASTVSEARLLANRTNSELSTGPKTAQGKAISSLNSLKTGLTGRTVLLPADDVAAYEAHCLRLQDKWKPEGEDESLLVQSIADTEWRLRRIPLLEFAIYAKGRTEWAAQADSTTEAASDPAMVDLETFLRYEKQIRNLTLQEGRLHRQRDKHISELRQLQSERLARPADQKPEAESAAAPVLPIDHGFVFSAASITLSDEPVAPPTSAPQSFLMETHAA